MCCMLNVAGSWIHVAYRISHVAFQSVAYAGIVLIAEKFIKAGHELMTGYDWTKLFRATGKKEVRARKRARSYLH